MMVPTTSWKTMPAKVPSQIAQLAEVASAQRKAGPCLSTAYTLPPTNPKLAAQNSQVSLCHLQI